MAAPLVYCSCSGFCPWSLCFVYYLPKQSLQNHKPDWVTTLCATDHLLTHREHQVLTAISHSDPVTTAFPSTCSAPYSIPEILGWVREVLSSGPLPSHFRARMPFFQREALLVPSPATFLKLSITTSAWAILSCSKALSLSDRRAWFCLESSLSGRMSGT